MIGDLKMHTEIRRSRFSVQDVPWTKAPDYLCSLVPPLVGDYHNTLFVTARVYGQWFAELDLCSKSNLPSAVCV